MEGCVKDYQPLKIKCQYRKWALTVTQRRLLLWLCKKHPKMNHHKL